MCVVTDEDTNSVGWSGSTSCQRGMHESAQLIYYATKYLPLESQSHDDNLSGPIIGGIIGGVIVGVAVLMLIIVFLFTGAMWYKKHSKQTKGVYSTTYTAFFHN